MTLPADAIRIEELEIFAKVGVPAEERAKPQRLVLSITLVPRVSFTELKDDLTRTVDYAAVCASLAEFAGGRVDRLIETLAEAMARHLLERFELTRVELELRKFVLPETKFVAVRLIREAAPGG
ncbi:MAG: dihydroneopterin aldolase [Chthoniobacterales bacterium]